MTGKDNGVATRLLSDNPYMVSMHCVAHKLALSCVDATKSVKEVGYYEDMLHPIHSYFSRSSFFVQATSLNTCEIGRMSWMIPRVDL